MAGLRIRWRRGSSGLHPPAAAAAQTSSNVSLDVFVWLAAALVVLFAFGLRIYNLNWYEDAHLHPDERFLTIVANDIHLPGPVEYFDSDSSPLNPYNLDNVGNFVYGTLPLFLTKTTGALLGMDTYDDLVIVGRALSALFSAATVFLIFLLGSRLHNPLAGLIGAALMATAPLAIQHAHFFVVDPFLTFFTTATLYYAVAIAQEGKPRHYALAGLMLGLGAACKVTGVVIVPVIVVAAVVHLYSLDRSGHSRWTMRPFVGLALAGLVAAIAFRVAQPYAFETPSLGLMGLFDLDDHWLADQRAQGFLLSGDALFPPTMQWIGRDSYFFPLQDMVLLGMGPAFGLAGWGAAVYASYRLLRYRDLRHLLPLVFVLAYFGFMGQQFSLYLRYFLPLYPVLAVLAGYALLELAGGVKALAQRRHRPQLANLGYGVMGIVLVTSLMAALAYFSIYTRPVTRVEASRWMYDNLPAGSRIAGEHWDDFAPFRLPGSPDRRFQSFELTLYNHDSPEKIGDLLNGLARADYVVISSNRLLNSIPRNPLTYPTTTRYYDLLLSEQLGFRLLREFTSYPGLLGVELADHKLEESWSSYDHPRVLVFQKTPEYSPDRLRTLLGQGPFATQNLTPKQADKGGLLLGAADLETQREGGTWSDVFSNSGIAKSHPTLLWLFALEAAALAVTPLALLLFRRLPDRGYLLAKPLGVLLLAYPVWLIVSLKLVTFTQTTILAVLFALIAMGVLTFVRSRVELTAFLKGNWPLILFSEALFLIAFFALRELRLENPDLWHPFRGGEKPMDLAFFTAVTRSTTLPPYDPWFAGGYVNYYYLGQFFTATLTRLTAIPPEVAFNLAIPTYFALTIAGAFSVAYNLAATVKGLLRRAPRFRTIPRWSPYAAGLLGAVFVAVAGNFDALDQYAERLAAVSSWRLDTPLPLVDPVANGIGGLWQVLFHGAELRPFDYWRSSRMLPPTISITEFPYFSFLFADLHAHMMAIAFEVLAIAAGLSLVLRRRGEEQKWQEWGTIVLLGLIVGSLRWLSSWDYPPFLLLALAAVAISERHAEGGLAATAIRLGLKLALLAGVSILAYKPFLDAYQAPTSGVQPAPEQTPIVQYLAHFGIFAALIGAWLLFLAVRVLRWTGLLQAMTMTELSTRGTIILSLLAIVLGSLVFAAGVLLTYDQPLVAFLLPAFVLVAILAVRELWLRRPDGGLRLYLLALAGLGLGLSMGVDLVTLNGDIQRMNTVFKFYLHAWIAFALVASFAAWYLLFVLWLPALRSVSRPALRLSAMAGSTALAALVLAALLYPAGATSTRLNDRFTELPRTLDGLAFMQSAVYADPKGSEINLAYDYDGIQWLRRNVEGTPAIVEGRTPLYRWGGRFSIYTGLPAVLGWDWHETQQRARLTFMVDERARAVDAFYASPNTLQALTFLRTYDVRYVIVGQVERLYYPAEGLAKFTNGLNGAIEVAHSNPGLTIYRVREEALASGAALSP
jgi:YYY domain-containing protein